MERTWRVAQCERYLRDARQPFGRAGLSLTRSPAEALLPRARARGTDVGSAPADVAGNELADVPLEGTLQRGIGWNRLAGQPQHWGRACAWRTVGAQCEGRSTSDRMDPSCVRRA